MPKVEWGKKVVCTNCEAKFYDLNRKPIICPKCGTEYSDLSLNAQEVNTKQVFGGNVDIVTDDNLVGSDASESIAEIEDGGNSTEELIPRGSSDPGDVAF